MEAFHSFWSAPNRVRNYGKVGLPDFELMTAILSALEWRKHNGKIRMITDSYGAEYFERLGLTQLWDRIDVTLDEVEQEVDPILFWAAGKLYALRSMEEPCVMLDTDLIIWKNLDEIWAKKRSADAGNTACKMTDYDIVAAHAEYLNPAVYPDPGSFRLKEGYRFPEEWDFRLAAANTAFLYLGDMDFKRRYTDEAIAFFKNVRPEGLNTVTAMCFAEQRVLPMMGYAHKQRMGYLLTSSDPDDQDFVTHTWGFKDNLRRDPEVREVFCKRCASRIRKEFPEQEKLLTGCDELRRYM